MSDKKVVIIGGGNAGMAAAHELYKSGVDFILLEAADTYGGRVQVGTYKGMEYNEGALFTEPGNRTTQAYIDEFGLRDKLDNLEKKTYGLWLNDKMSYFVDDGNLIAAMLKFRGLPASIIPQGAKFLAKIGSAMKKVDQSDPNFTSLKEYSNISTYDWTNEAGVPEITDKLVGPMIRAMTIGRSVDTSVAHTIALFSAMSGMCSVHGGLKQINDAIYEEVKDKVRLNTAAERVLLEGDKIVGVKLASGEVIDTDKVIMAVDAVDAARILSEANDAIKDDLATASYSSAWHYCFYAEKLPTPENYILAFIPESYDANISTVMVEDDRFSNVPKGAGFLHTWTVGWKDDVLMPMSEDERLETVLKQMDIFWPSFRDQVELVTVKRYERAVNLEPVGQHAAILDLKQNHSQDYKGLYFAGEYMFLVACTEGAWTYGKIAAQKLISEL